MDDFSAGCLMMLCQIWRAEGGMDDLFVAAPDDGRVHDALRSLVDLGMIRRAPSAEPMWQPTAEGLAADPSARPS